MNDLHTVFNLPNSAATDLHDPPELRLQAVSTRTGAELLPCLLDAVDRASGWVLHRQMVSASTLQLHMEIQDRSLLDLYASLIEQGLELGRDSHQLLTERCSCAHLSRQARSSILTLHLEVTLPADAYPLGHWWRLRTA